MTDAIQIRGDIPLPSRQRAKPSKYPFQTLKPGMCFLVPGYSKALRQRIWVAIRKRKAAYPEEDYESRRWEDPKGKAFFGVWRTK